MDIRSLFCTDCKMRDSENVLTYFMARICMIFHYDVSNIMDVTLNFEEECWEKDV